MTSSCKRMRTALVIRASNCLSASTGRIHCCKVANNGRKWCAQTQIVPGEVRHPLSMCTRTFHVVAGNQEDALEQSAPEFNERRISSSVYPRDGLVAEDDQIEEEGETESRIANASPNSTRLRELVDANNMEEACELLAAMFENNDEHNPEPPTFGDFQYVLEGFRNAKGRRHAEMATEVLDCLKEYKRRTGIGLELANANLTPLFHIVMSVWLTCTTPPRRIMLKHVDDIVEIATFAKSTLREMESRNDCLPTRTSYNLVLNCYTRAAIAVRSAELRFGHSLEDAALAAAETAEELVIQMTEARDDACKPDEISVRCLLTAWSNVCTLEGTDRILAILDIMEDHMGELNAKMYSIAFNALAQAAPLREFDPSDPEAPANKSVALLRRLVAQLRNDGMTGSLDNMCYASVINAFAKSQTEKNYGELAPANLANACLRQCAELHEIGYLRDGPNDYCYGNAIAAWTRHVDANHGSLKAEHLLERFERHVGTKRDSQHRRQRMTIWYNMVLYSLARSTLTDGPERADYILARMEDAADERSYHAVIQAWATTRHKTIHDRAKRAEDCLKRMKRPHIMCYNMTLAACAASEIPSSGLIIAEKVFRDIPRPNEASYSRLMSVYNSLLSNNEMKREEKLSRVFERCAKRGLVDMSVIRMLREGMTREGTKRLLGEQYVTVSQDVVDFSKLPASWTRSRGKSRTLKNK